MSNQRCAILDAGAQYGKLIDRRIRELNVESVMLPLDTPVKELQLYRAVIISGAAPSVFSENAPKYDPRLFELQKPMLGICYGMQLMNHALGGSVETKAVREDGQLEVELDPASLLFQGLERRQKVLLTHGDSVERVAQGFRVTGRSGALPTAMEDAKRQYYAVQFHPEVDLTPNGKAILKNFLFGVARFSGDYTVEDREGRAIREIQERVGGKKVLVLVSGGVDSAVCATLVQKAVGAQRVIAIHVDTGFMREGESMLVKKTLEGYGIRVTVRDASEQFRVATETALLPEHKRKIIGDTYMRVVDTVIRELGLMPSDVYLAQGSLRPDLIESASALASKSADVIKTHHNDSPLVRELRQSGRVIEPLRDYHKDEVRQLAALLGLPNEIVWRQPFPGPGLAIRILCAEQPAVSDDYDAVNRKLNEEYSRDGLFSTLLPIRSVGVQGDGRSYKHAVALSGNVSWDRLAAAALNIPKHIHSVNRVVYVFGDSVSGPVTDITPTHLTTEVLDKLRRADAIVDTVLRQHGISKNISQMPVVLLPLPFGQDGKHSIALRPFITNDFMTGVAALPGKDIPEAAVDEIVKRLMEDVPGIARVMYDLTGKPPATTEWE